VALAVGHGPSAGLSSRRWHTLGSGYANSLASSAGGRSGIPVGRRPVAGHPVADPAGTTGGKLCMVSSGPLAS
ncbi:MAG: hypothetical protein WBN92_19875, partial [Terriglobia bacterium]